ncbi:unnamed protein product [Colias eurytheme]|nr:unnamed protein product [Colias eurytheme]
MKWRSDRLIKVRMNTGTLIQLLLSTLVASERKPQAGRGPGGRRAEGRWLGDALADPVPCTGLANGTRLRSYLARWGSLDHVHDLLLPVTGVSRSANRKWLSALKQ